MDSSFRNLLAFSFSVSVSFLITSHQASHWGALESKAAGS